MKTQSDLLFFVLVLLLAEVPNGFAFYNPQTGRWLNRDPIAEGGGLNLYGFLDEQPIHGTDLLGTCGGGGTCKICCVRLGPKPIYEWDEQGPTWHKHRFAIYVVLEQDGTAKDGCECQHDQCDFRQKIRGHAYINGKPISPPLRSSGSGLLIDEKDFVDGGYSWKDNQAHPDDVVIFVAVDEPAQRNLQSFDDVDYYLEFIAQVLDKGKNNAVIGEKKGYWIRTRNSYQRQLKPRRI